MKGLQKNIAMIFAVLLLAVSIAFMAGTFDDKVAPGTITPEPQMVDEFYTVKAEARMFYEQIPATIKAKETTLVASRILSKITEVKVRAGDYVNAGDTLIKLEQGDLKARLQQAKANALAVEANLKEATSQHKRVQELQAKGMLSQSDLDKSQARKSSLEANLQQAQQQLEETQVALNYSQITAPISGRVVERFAEPGDTVQPGQSLLSIYNPKALWAEANVRESLALSLQTQDKLMVFIPALKQQLTAVLEEMVPAGHTGSRSFLIKALLLENPQLMPGMFAEIAIAAGEQTQIYVPESYVGQLGQLALVWVYNGSQLQRRFVRLGENIDGKWQVVSGLEPGEQIAPAKTGE